MSPEAQIITDEIKSIKNDLDRSNDTSPDYLPTDIKELRSHILQVHATFETCMEIVIWQDYFGAGKPLSDFTEMFERMTFEDKRLIIRRIQPNFPNPRKLNELRNYFAHQKGEVIRAKYGDHQKRLDAYRLLKSAHDKLNQFFAARQP